MNAVPHLPPCCRKHCSNIGTVEAVLRVPARGGDKANALTLPVGVRFCTGHARTVNAGEFTGAKFRARVFSFCRSMGDARPDFKAAWLEFKPGA